MFDLLDNPIQCEDNDAIVELRLKLYGTNNNKSQLITLPDGTSISVDYDEVLPCMAIRKPTKYEVRNCEQI